MNRTIQASVVLLLAGGVAGGHAQLFSVKPDRPGSRPPVTYRELVDAVNVTDEQVAARLLGRTTTLNLKQVRNREGGILFLVSKKDDLMFECRKIEPGFRGGVVTAALVGYEPGGDGRPSYFLDMCGGAR
ncbi:MAG: hypothetical protein KKC79_07915 [Gammaproteobacteria bacterium]|nr:hypothetical protein [Gammaproteobacteria bacterium]MBU1441273.1 hypothetical protein [Gammaproteobacteria bacterium]MBU2288301.1 hypothetical protein [Gammaproteobacteria bacterium]MBU2408561.1 hypothetical protein [Gammaproteobacteria bacterium]